MPDQPDPVQKLADSLLAQHQGDPLAALADLAQLYLVARHGWCAGYDRATPTADRR